jgi:hypothetical protein
MNSERPKFIHTTVIDSFQAEFNLPKKIYLIFTPCNLSNGKQNFSEQVSEKDRNAPPVTYLS